MADIFKYIDPRNWLWWALGALTVVAGLWFGIISPYNNYVSAKAVVAALAKERAEKQPIIDELAMRVANADKTITDYKTESDKLKVKVATNQGILNATIKKLDKSTAELAVLRGTDDEFKRLLDSATANIGITTDASATAKLRQLTSAHYQCQAGFRDERTSHAKTIAGLEQALAMIESLK